MNKNIIYYIIFYIQKLNQKLPIIALVNYFVVPLPPKSPVTYFFYFNTLKTESYIFTAYSSKFICFNIFINQINTIVDDNIKAVGLANPFPAISGAVP